MPMKRKSAVTLMELQFLVATVILLGIMVYDILT